MYSLLKMLKSFDAFFFLHTYRYGDIHPLLELEKWFAIVCMLWGIVMFGYILGGLASILTNQDAQRARYVNRLDAIKTHLVCTFHCINRKVL